MMAFKRSKVAIIFTILSPCYTFSFPTVCNPLDYRNAAFISTRLHAETNLLESRYYQLEEMEDKDSSTSEIFLSSDGSVHVGLTSGPVPVESHGQWTLDDQELKMTISRTYSTGVKGSGGLGEFEFEVSRSFIGTITQIGDSTGVSGSMHLFDEILGDLTVGYFSMIDTTEAKLATEVVDTVLEYMKGKKLE